MKITSKLSINVLSIWIKYFSIKYVIKYAGVNKKYLLLAPATEFLKKSAFGQVEGKLVLFWLTFLFQMFYKVCVCEEFFLEIVFGHHKHELVI